MYNWALSKDLVEFSPVSGIPRPGAERRRDRVLSEYEIKEIWIFPNPRNRSEHIREVQKLAQRVRGDAGLSYRAHDFRRTAASMMAGMGVPRLVISKILNHVGQGVTSVYDRHSYDREKQGALNA